MARFGPGISRAFFVGVRPKKITEDGGEECGWRPRGGWSMQRCKSERSSCAKVEKWDQSTEYGGQSTECGKIAVQRCKSAYGLWKGAKMKREW